jgi:hypothetical protein
MIGYNYWKEREKMWKRYESGKESEWFSSFGNEHKAVENACRYEQLIKCGYSHEQAMTFDDSGWIKDNYCRAKFCKRYEIVRTKEVWCAILTFQLPNKKWVAGHEYTYPSGGCFCGCSIYGKQFDTERQARHSELVHIIKGLEKITWDSSEKMLLPQLKKAALSCLQLELF